MGDNWHCPKCTIKFLTKRPAFGSRTEILRCPEKGCHVRFGNLAHQKKVGSEIKPVCRMWLEGAQI